MPTITSRDFNHDVGAAKRAAEVEPVTITDHGRPSHVLITAALFDQLTGHRRRVGTRLKAQGVPVDFDLPDRRIDDSRVPDL
ncbi:MAG: prevent-host-death protein [Microbacterium sp. SCN 70-200]|uniref:type II toxin-antitoxin system prevent-host-death family antitoxin n=1 Tax=unclassified Microbacterium TaxID=2609290 RepID=UPI000868FFAF|nr:MULTISPECIES: type II toxin-antitoxin system prevent-host-death family antitoxin [unclassified Microbacterium]MBN9216014.1 type II toxin-antitoxin system prevent-host-death family antitoxin [Microbacterium sp.]ODT40348.1 MAG: prevent-host-death protein [Microbacterium sp. SCN 70-200]OJV82019.1 MAG: prevent-host-death protein [Microbacterium sp. 70-16]